MPRARVRAKTQKAVDNLRVINSDYYDNYYRRALHHNVRLDFWPGPDGMRVLIVGGVPGQIYRAPEVTELGARDPGRDISAAMTHGPRGYPDAGSANAAT